MTVRILVVDDHPIVRAGIAGLLATEPDFEVVGEAESGETALDIAATLRPDVVLMDLRMPGMGGVEATRRLTRSADPAPRVLIFTTYEEDDQILAAIEAGANGYLVKAAPAEELAAGVRAVAAGQTVLAPSIAVQLVARAHSGAERREEPGPRLTAREVEILRLVAAGMSNPEIAASLFIGESTVKTHLLRTFEKLGVSDRTRAVTRAMECGIL
ncbi:response regulator [Leucobacter chromiiresistens]|uniref:DNA-binding response regulator, NarL/FixJ family, contains REC and HTH domains n=1 Tax=Leucobacter chromiiresistens TaxID=1079994 RepID=A0A1H0YE85_9MICO|nr:response regulator transcription factor [Leucobacter chromiiresistens]SDQ13343.1 DNA-binding response regulator, NarL/FixJ family, contains REC and HTH domains [Leucobacter chromiiresistens]